ncbi:MAG: hypothetical protein ACRDWI_16865 [Jiangellaceae bacterium]
MTAPLDADHPHKYNHQRLHSACSDIPPVEYEHNHYHQLATGEPAS